MHVPGYTMASCQASSIGFLTIASAPDLNDYTGRLHSEPEGLMFLSSAESGMPSSERSGTPEVPKETVFKARISSLSVQDDKVAPATESPKRSLAACLAMPMEAVEDEVNDEVESLVGKESRRPVGSVIGMARCGVQ